MDQRHQSCRSHGLHHHVWHMFVAIAVLVCALGALAAPAPVAACSPTEAPLTPLPPTAVVTLPPTPPPQTRYRAMVGQANVIVVGTVLQANYGSILLTVQETLLGGPVADQVTVTYEYTSCDRFSIPDGLSMLVLGRAADDNAMLTIHTIAVDRRYLRREEALLRSGDDRLQSMITYNDMGSFAALRAVILADSRAARATAIAPTIAPVPLPMGVPPTPAAVLKGAAERRVVWFVGGVLIGWVINAGMTRVVARVRPSVDRGGSRATAFWTFIVGIIVTLLVLWAAAWVVGL